MGDDPSDYGDKSTEQSYGWSSSGSLDTATDGESKSLTGEQLHNAETDTSPQSSPLPAEVKSEKDLIGDGYNQDDSGGGLRRLVGTKRRKIALGTGIAGFATGGIMLGLLGIGSGPLQFIHIAALLSGIHFSAQENAGDTRFGKIVRFVRSGGDAGQTRLTYLESKYNDRIIRTMQERGITPRFEKGTKYFSSVVIDANDPKSPYSGKSPEEIRSALNDRFGSKITVSQISGIGNGKFVVKGDGFWTQRKSLRLLTQDMGYSKITTAARVRILGKYGVVTWHPLRILDKKFNSKIASIYDQWRENRQQRLKNGVQDGSVDSTKASLKDENGKSTPLNGTNDTLSSGSIKDTLNQIAGTKSFKVAGGVAAAAGLVCIAKALNDNAAAIKYQQVIMPLMRMGMEAVTVGNQVMSGDDVDQQELDFLSRNFTEVKDGKTVSSWDQARSIQAETGDPLSGPDISPAAKAGFEPFTFLDWTNNPAVKTLCSGAGTAISTGLGVVLGVISGGTVSLVAGIAASAFAGPYVVEKLAGLIAGDAVNVLATGAEWGNDINYGARLGSNAMALQFGGTALSSTQALALRTDFDEQQRDELKQESIASRLFNLGDYRSLASRVADSIHPTTTNLASSLTSAATSLFRMPLSIFSSTVHADPQPYDYGFEKYGFSLDEQQNPVVDNPYENADAVAKLLDGPNGSDYINKASQCFGVNISKGPNGWDVLPGGTLVNPYDTDHYDAKGCRAETVHDTDDWLRIRFFILDTGTMEGYACVQGDDVSCQNDGFTDTSSTTTTATNTSSADSTKFNWPIAANIIQGIPVTNCWRQAPPGTGHTGIDIPVPVGTPVLAPKAGTVVQIGGPSGDAGNYIIIKHNDGHWTNYQHLSQVEVKVGDGVAIGQEIAKSGNTGFSTGAHLHFSITTAPTLASRHNTTGSIDPLPLMSASGGPNLACN